MIIDTHCHLFSDEFNEDRGECIKKAQKSGVKNILLPNIDASSIQSLYQTENAYQGICYAMMGLHPTSVNEHFEDELKIIEKELQSRAFAGIGEIGIDLYWDKTFLKEQKIAFKKQLQWAVQYQYPISIHCRNAFDEIFELLDSLSEIPKGVFHCFTGTKTHADKIIAYKKFKLGIGGVITFKKTNLSEVLSDIDVSHFVLETDAPYLTPMPFRGKRNEPAFIIYIAEKLSEIKKVSIDEILSTCYQNTLQVFDKLNGSR